MQKKSDIQRLDGGILLHNTELLEIFVQFIVLSKNGEKVEFGQSVELEEDWQCGHFVSREYRIVRKILIM